MLAHLQRFYPIHPLRSALSLFSPNLPTSHNNPVHSLLCLFLRLIIQVILTSTCKILIVCDNVDIASFLVYLATYILHPDTRE